jgi:hypothetical protein
MSNNVPEYVGLCKGLEAFLRHLEVFGASAGKSCAFLNVRDDSYSSRGVRLLLSARSRAQFRKPSHATNSMTGAAKTAAVKYTATRYHLRTVAECDPCHRITP